MQAQCLASRTAPVGMPGPLTCRAGYLNRVQAGSSAPLSASRLGSFKGNRTACKERRPRFELHATKGADRPGPSKRASLDALFVEPLIRALLLGMGTAVALESAHGAMQCLEVLNQMPSLLPDLSSLNPPLFLADHVAAIGGAILFFAIESAAIMSVLRAFPNDKEAAARAAGRLVTLPKRMLPLKLAVVKRVLLQSLGTPQPSGAAAAPLSSSGAAAGTHAVLAAPTSTTFKDAPVRPGSVPMLPPQIGLPKTVLPGAASTRPQLAPGIDDGAPPRARSGGSLEESRARRGLRPGQLDEDSSGLAKRQKELAGRESYLANFWYAAALSQKVTEKPLGVGLLGQKLVLFRGKDGRVRCLGDICPHRGAPLSGGWVAEVEGHDCVVCPYHGWAFNEHGVLLDVPAAEHPGEWPKRQLIEAYPVEERGGFVWVFCGSKQLPADERPPIPFVPELEAEGWKAAYGEIEFGCNHHAVFENAIDMAHIHYLHSNSFGNQDQPRIRDMQCTSDAYGVTATFKLNNKAVRGWEWAKVPEVEVTARAFLPSTSAISFTLGNGLSFTTFVNVVPISYDKTVARFTLVRNLSWDNAGLFNADAFDVWARRAMIRILSEDKAMVEQLRPDLLPQEFSVRADLPQIAFRKLRQSYVDLGYGISPLRGVERFRSDF